MDQQIPERRRLLQLFLLGSLALPAAALAGCAPNAASARPPRHFYGGGSNAGEKSGGGGGGTAGGGGRR